MTIFGREPTLWIGFIGQAILLVGTFGLHMLNGQQAALIVVALNALFAAINAYAVRPISPAIFTYAVGSVVAVVGAYGLTIPIETVAGINALVISALVLMTRGQVAPQETAVSKA
jgi:hypothetical protein